MVYLSGIIYVWVKMLVTWAVTLKGDADVTELCIMNTTLMNIFAVFSKTPGGYRCSDNH